MGVRTISLKLALVLVLSLVPPALPASEVGFVGPPILIPAGDPDSADFVGPVQIGPFEILGAEVLPGQRERLEWAANMSFSGSGMASPVVVLHGVRPGPVLCLTAGIHGDELNSVEIVRRIANAVDPADLGGTLITVPVVNLFGFSRSSRYLPDRRDLNRYFPGTPYGSIASRIAHSFFSEVMSHCDALVDFHTGSFDRRNLPQIRADLSNPKVREFTHGLGATPVLHSSGSRGMLRTASTQAGIPALTFEVGGPGELEPEKIHYGEQAIHTLLHKLGMTRDRPTWDEPQPIYYESTWVRADVGGLLLGEVELGQYVDFGQVLGVVIDPLNNTERELVSPVSGRVIGMARNQIVLPGFAMFHLGEEASEQQVASEAERGSRGVIDEDEQDANIDPEALPLDDGQD